MYASFKTLNLSYSASFIHENRQYRVLVKATAIQTMLNTGNPVKNSRLFSFFNDENPFSILDTLSHNCTRVSNFASVVP